MELVNWQELSSYRLTNGVPGILLHNHLYVGRGTLPDIDYATRTLIANAEVMYVWLDRVESPDFTRLQGIDIGYAYSIGLPLVIGATDNSVLQAYKDIARQIGVSSNINWSYASLMADADMFKRDVWECVDTLVPTNCCVCGGPIPHRAYISRRGEVCHVDCYVRSRDLATQPPYNVLFNSELIASLREDNARLEQALSLKQSA